MRARLAARLAAPSLTVALTLPAGAAKLHLAVHGPSRHLDSAVTNGRPYHERNWGAGLRWQRGPTVALQAGQYRNSFHRTSRYVVAEWTPLRSGIWQAGAFGGVVSGYAGPGGGGFLARAQGERLSLVLRVLPVISPKVGTALALELGWRL